MRATVLGNMEVTGSYKALFCSTRGSGELVFSIFLGQNIEPPSSRVIRKQADLALPTRESRKLRASPCGRWGLGLLLWATERGREEAEVPGSEGGWGEFWEVGAEPRLWWGLAGGAAQGPGFPPLAQSLSLYL